MENIIIKQATIKNINELQKISRQTFLESFSSGNTEENMKKYLDEKFSKEKLMAEMNDPNSAFYFAVIEGNIIGYIKLNVGRSQTELQNESGLELERIYVLQEFRGKRIGQALYEKTIQVATEKNTDYIWLGVWEKNLRAINFYKRNGFIEFDKHIFILGDEEQIDIMMKLPLKHK